MGDKITRFAQLYTSLSQSYTQNPMEITRELENLYSEPDSILVLFDLFFKAQTDFLRKSVAIGIKQSFVICCTQLNNEFINLIWNKLLNVLFLEENSEIIECFLIPLESVFEAIGGKWNYLVDFFSQLVQKNQIEKCLKILSSIIQEIPYNDIISNIDQIVQFIQVCMSSPSHLNNSNYIFYIVITLIYECSQGNNDLQQKLYSAFQNPLSSLFNECLQFGNSQIIQKVSASLCITSNFEIDYPLDINEIFAPVILFLQSPDKELISKIYIIDLLGNILQQSNIEVPIETIINLLDLSLNFSVIAFDQLTIGDEKEEPTSILTQALIQACLERLSTDKILEIIEPRFWRLTNLNIPSHFYTSILLIIDVFQQSQEYIIQIKENLFDLLISGLSIPKYSIREIIIEAIKTFKYIFLEQIHTNLQQLIQHIIELSINSAFVQADELIYYIIKDIGNTDPVFEMIFSHYFKVLSTSPDFQTTITIWHIFTETILNSIVCVRSYFDSIYQLSLMYITNENAKISFIKSEAFHCIASLSKCCPDLFSQKINEIKPIVLAFFSSDDFTMKDVSIFALQCFFNYLNTTDVESFLPVILPTIFDVCSKDYTEDFLKNNIDSTFTNIISKCYTLLSIIIKKFPNYFQADENILMIFKCFHQGLLSCYNIILLDTMKLFHSMITITLPFKEVFREEIMNIVEQLINNIQREKEIKVISAFVSGIKISIQEYGILILNGNESNLFNLCLTLIESKFNPHTHEFVFINEFHSTITLLLREIIYSTQVNFEWMNVYIPRLIVFLECNNKSLKSMSILIFSEIIQKPILLPDEFLLQLVNYCVNSLGSDDPIFAKTSCDFLKSLSKNYQNLLINVAPQIIQIIIPRSLQLQKNSLTNIDFVEKIIALFAVIDELVPVTNENLMDWFLKFIPFDVATENNTIAYNYLLRHFDEFKNSNVRMQMMKSILEVFCRDKNTLHKLMISPNVVLKLLIIANKIIKNLPQEELMGLTEGKFDVLFGTINELNNLPRNSV